MNPVCPNECSHSGICSNGQCQCFRGFEGADCSVHTPTKQRCGGRCAGSCLAKCQPSLDAPSQSASGGRQCYAECAKRCLSSCVLRRRTNEGGVGGALMEPEGLEEALPEFPAALMQKESAAPKAEVEVVEVAAVPPPPPPSLKALEKAAVDELSELLVGLHKGRR